MLGNPPWITAAALGKLGSTNQPSRRNFKELPGIQARTGSSNFDIAEAVWIKLMEELAECEPTIALLCKTSVARSVLEFAARKKMPIVSASIHQIDAKCWFGASASACLLRVHLGGAYTCPQVPVFASIEDKLPAEVLHFQDGRLIAGSAIAESGHLVLGKSPVCWRQGVKHDAAAIMELTAAEANGTQVYRNGLGDQVEVEPEFVYPLLKGADLRRAPARRPRCAVIITQTRLGQDTAEIEHRSPQLWRYLQRHAARLRLPEIVDLSQCAGVCPFRRWSLQLRRRSRSRFPGSIGRRFSGQSDPWRAGRSCSMTRVTSCLAKGPWKRPW